LGVGLFLGTALGTAAAQTDDGALDTPIAVPETPAAISDVDAAMAERLEGILSQLDGLEDVTVNVRDGVVTLGGEVANEPLAERADAIARRLDGTVAVQDSIERTLNVTDNVGRLNADWLAWLDDFVAALPLMALALGTLIAITLLGRFLGKRTGWLSRFLGRRNLNPFLAEVAGTLIKLAFFVLGLVVALNLLGAGAVVTTILGGAGVVGIAFGFAIRDTLENYISSILLSIRQPFRAGDHVVINATHEGKVARLTSRATILVTLDGNHLRVPNADVFKGTILNFTTNTTRRFTFELGVDSADDPVDAISRGTARLSEFDFILKDPAPGATIVNVGDSSIVIRYQAWIDQRGTDFGKSRSLSIQAVKNTLETHGFSLPEPIYRVKVDGVKGDGVKVDGVKVDGTLAAQVNDVTPDVADAELDVTPDNGSDDTAAREAAMEGNLLSDSAEVE